MVTISTSKGELSIDKLYVKSGVDQGENADCAWTEYRLLDTDEVVRRDVNVIIKRGVAFFDEQAQLS